MPNVKPGKERAYTYTDSKQFPIPCMHKSHDISLFSVGTYFSLLLFL